MNKPIRVLHILNGLGSGGTESFIMNIYRNIDRSKVQFDFLIRSAKENLLVEEINSLGGIVYITSEFPRHFQKNYKEINKFFKANKDYSIVHLHANALMYVKPLGIAKRYGVKCRIIHSHNTQTAKNPFYRYIHRWNKKFISEKATDFLACSTMAGDWMFNNTFKVINNAIDVKKFSYNELKRNQIRKKYNIEGKFVIGNIGRFTHQKNHSFILDIFKEVYSMNKESVLMLVGTGELINEVKLKVKSLGLQDSVIFTGARNDIPDLLSSMDVFLLPSHFEGLGIVLIEAQASGLYCIASENVIPKEAKVTELLEFLPLTKSSKEWANIILDKNKLTRQNTFNQIKNAGFDISNVAKDIEQFYLEKYYENTNLI